MANVGAGRVPGHAGVDEPVGELAQRVLGRPDAGGLARHRRPRRRDAARARAAVLRPPEGRARRRDHRRGRVRHDRRGGAARGCAASRASTSGSRSRRSSACSRSACSRASSSASRSRSPGSSTSPRRRCRCSAARPARVFRELESTRRRDVPDPCCARRRPVLRDRRGARRPRPRARRGGSGLARGRARPRGRELHRLAGRGKLAELRELLERDGIDLRLARVKPQVRSVLEADGFALSGA